MTESDVDTILNQEGADIDNQAFCSAEAKDLAFNIYRSNTDRHRDMKSIWTAFNKTLYQVNRKPATVIGQMPLLNAKVDDHDTI